MGDIKQTNFRLDEDKVAEFRAFCESEGFNQAQGFDHLMHILSLERAKEILSNRETEITEFQMHAKAIVDAFVRSLELCNNAEERIREDFSSQLEMKDQQISDYQKTVISLNEQLKEQSLATDMAQKEKEILETSVQEMNTRIDAANKQAETYRISNDALTTSLALANEKAQQNEEAAKNYFAAMNTIEESKKSYQQLESSLNQLKEQHKNEITLLQHDHAAELKQIRTQNQLDIKAAEETIKSFYQEKIDVLKNEYEEKIEKLNLDISKRIDSYQEKLEKANEKLDVLRDKLQEEMNR